MIRQSRSAVWALYGATLVALPSLALGQVQTTATMDEEALAIALKPVGLSIDAVTITNGLAGQFGTYVNFELRPVTIRPGIVLSSGDVAQLGPIPGATEPDYDPASPPIQVNSQMDFTGDGSTPEFNAYGLSEGNIENFNGSFDVAALRVDFTLEADSPVKFDFLFGSVEFPYWTSQFTDSFLVFLDGTAPENQITFDAAGNAVQVGSSFAGLETTGDLNSAFSNPHGLIHHLTTTTATLQSGEHFLIFEVGDVNDHILDSAVFIADLRAEAGTEGTEPTEDPPYEGCPHITAQPVNAITCPSGLASFTVQAVGDEPMTYQWRKDDEPIDPVSNPSAATATLILSSAQASDASQYNCLVTNDCGDEDSRSAVLTLTNPGDMNCDGSVNNFDIDPFVLGLLDPNGYVAAYPGCVLLNADVNCDGLFNNFDIDPFVILILGL